jgi:hypothetical protein
MLGLMKNIRNIINGLHYLEVDWWWLILAFLGRKMVNQRSKLC